MTNEVANQNEAGPLSVPSGLGRDALPANISAGINAGAVTIEIERAVAETKGKIYLAKSFPRNLTQSHLELMESCRVYAFAEKAFYKRPQGRDEDGNQKHITGESIRLAEEIARVCGNFDYGHRELSRTDDRSEVEVYAWDMEKNNHSRRQITVKHVQDTRNGPRKLRDQADVDARIANVASKQMRSRILALVPKWLLADAVAECKKTLAGGDGKPLAQRIRDMVQRFAFFGVTVAHLEKYVGKNTDAFTGDDLAELFGVYNAIKEGEAPVEYFSDDEGADKEKPTVGPKPGEQTDKPHPAAAASEKKKAGGKGKAEAAESDKAPPEPEKKPEPPKEAPKEEAKQSAAAPAGKEFF